MVNHSGFTVRALNSVIFTQYLYSHHRSSRRQACTSFRTSSLHCLSVPDICSVPSLFSLLSCNQWCSLKERKHLFSFSNSMLNRLTVLFFCSSRINQGQPLLLLCVISLLMKGREENTLGDTAPSELSHILMEGWQLIFAVQTWELGRNASCVTQIFLAVLRHAGAEYTLLTQISLRCTGGSSCMISKQNGKIRAGRRKKRMKNECCEMFLPVRQ